jgi:rRNA processing protein Gar1
LPNKTQFGAVDEIFGPINEVVRYSCPSRSHTVASARANVNVYSLFC